MFELRYLALFIVLVAAPLTFTPTIGEAAGTHSDQDFGKQSIAQLSKAESAFDDARAAYDKGEIEKGDAALEDMTKALDACLGSLEAAHKARFYKKAELKVATLQRRLSGLLDDISIEQRGWAEQTSRKLEEIHDKLLAGAMRK